MQRGLVIYYSPAIPIHVYLCEVQKYPAAVIFNDYLGTNQNH